MSSHRRSQSNSGSESTYTEVEADSDEGSIVKEHLNLNQKMISRATRNDDMTKENGRQPNESLKSATRGAVQASNISTLSSGDGGTDDQILASIPAAQVAPRDSRGIQALPIHIGSDPLFSIALQRALYQGLGTMNTGPRSGQFSDNADTGARSSGLENPRIPARTSHYPDTSRNSPTSMMRLLSDMKAVRSREELPAWNTGLLRRQSSIFSQQHSLPSTAMQDRINAELSTQRSYYPIHQYGNQALSSRAPSSDPFLSIALHNALQQQLDTIASNRRSDHRRANVHPEAYSSVADSRIITNAFASQVASVLPPTSPIPSSQGLGTSSNLSVPSRLQQLLTDRSIGPPNVAAGAQSSTVGQSHPSAVLAIAALLLQVGDGRGGVLASTDGSAMSTSNSTASSAFGRDHTERAVDGTQNQATSPSVGMARPLPNLPTSQHLPFLLQDPAFLEQALPTVMRMGGSGLAQVLLSAPVRHTRADSGASSLSLCAPLGHVEDQKLPRIIYVTSDDDSLSPYQCLVRKQIQLFEASETDIHATAQGRNRPIIVGQVGIRCIHCGRLPIERRARGAVYFPSTLMSTYQTAQNMANSHLMKDCLDIPRYIREDLVRIRLRENSESQNTRKSAFGGGRAYWARGLQTNHGVIETEDQRLKFDSSSIVP